MTYEEGAVVQAGKRGFKRPRPFILEPRIEPIVKKPTNDSYPSGHAMWSRVVGLLLADMLPEYSDKIMARADDFAFHRVVAGVHYPSDVEAGKHAGTALAAFLFASPAFQADYAAATRELRTALNLSPQPSEARPTQPAPAFRPADREGFAAAAAPSASRRSISAHKSR